MIHYDEFDFWDVIGHVMQDAAKLTNINQITLKGRGDVNSRDFLASISDIDFTVTHQSHAFDTIEDNSVYEVMIARVDEERERITIEYKLCPDSIDILSNGSVVYKRGKPDVDDDYEEFLEDSDE